MVTTFYPPHVGGIEYHVENLSRQLSKNGHKITILTSLLPKQQLLSNTKYSDGIEVIRVKMHFPLRWIYPSLSSQGFALNVRKTIKQIIKNKHIDLVHVHGHHYYLSWQAIIAARQLKIPSILTIHGLYALSPSNLLGRIEEEIFNYTVFRQELKKVVATIGLTPKIINYAQKYSQSSGSYFNIPNGINSQVFVDNRKNRFIYRQKYGIKNNHIVILFVGRFTSIKGILKLAEAAKLVVEKNKDAFFLFVGGGLLMSELVKTLQPIKANFKIIGWITPDKIHELYLASDIFVLPSKSEALPLTILEAMAAKLYIVASPVGGIPEVLRDYPFKTFIEKINQTKLCNLILRTIEQFEQNAPVIFGQPSEIWCLNNFNWEKITYNVEKVYAAVRDQAKKSRKIYQVCC